MAFKLLCLALVLSLVPTAVLGQKLRTSTADVLVPICNEPNEQLVATGGGCYVDAKGVQQCAPAPPPTCKCVTGFERNPTTQKCEAAAAPGASLRSTRDTQDKQPNCGANASKLPIIGGCFVNDQGQHDCPPRDPSICVCNEGYVRHPASKMCDRPSSHAAPVTEDPGKKLPECGPKESYIPFLGACYINQEGKQDCSQRQPPICVCFDGFVRNPTTKKCEAAGAARVTRDLQGNAPECGPNQVLTPVIGGCIIKDGKHDCSQRAPPTCECKTGYQRNQTTKKCEISVTAIHIGRARRSPRCKKCQTV